MRLRSTKLHRFLLWAFECIQSSPLWLGYGFRYVAATYKAASLLIIYKRNRELAYDQSAATDKFTLCNQRDCIFLLSNRLLYFGVFVDVRIGFQFMLLGVGFLDEEYTHGSYYKQYACKHYHVELMLTAK